MSNYIRKYGLNTLIPPTLLFIIGIYIGNTYIIIISLLLAGICYNFFQRPNIKIKKDKSAIISPSFGRIQKIMKIDNKVYISIFLSIFDPHIQYVPYNGLLLSQIYKKGTFRAAFLWEKSTFNERMIHNFETRVGTISVVQIAGMIARTIIPFISARKDVKKGDEIGMIKFGSRVDIIVPIKGNEDMKILVKQGQYVYGGETVLIKLNK
tara:strand:+ start:378 stop:1004 length:627 start_codon:yes stop_codon:yes gene_type:complete